MGKKLPEGTWDIVAYRSEDALVPVLDGSAPHIEVDSERVAGMASINRVMGSSRDLPLGPMAMTMMAGPPELMDQEHRIATLLGEADDVVSGLSGMFLLADGLIVIEMVRRGTKTSHEDV